MTLDILSQLETLSSDKLEFHCTQKYTMSNIRSNTVKIPKLS